MSHYKHIIMASGGVCSWAAAKRVVQQFGTDGVIQVFADTKMEDEDLYRFLDEGAVNVGVPLVKLADGRTPWEVMRDKHIIANSKIDPCSSVLKRDLLDKWRNKHATPEDSVIYLGLDWTEMHRVERVNKRCAPWTYKAPMAEPPYLTKQQMLEWLKSEGICPPRLYTMGFPHNNCGGFCVKAGQAHFAHLLRTMPERYRFHEEQEQEMRKIVGDHSILRDRKGGVSRTITLREFRQRIEAQGEFDMQEWGGCGCAVE